MSTEHSCTIGLLTCTGIRGFLKLSEECASCDEVQLELLDRGPAVFALEHAEILAEAGFPGLANLLKKPDLLYGEEFACPEHEDLNIMSTCGLSSCEYNIHDEGSGNCLHRYLEKQDKFLGSELSVGDIAQIEQTSEEEIKRAQKSAMQRVSANSIKKAVAMGQLEADLYYVPNIRICVSCETPIGKAGLYFEYGKKRYFYCSPECRADHPTFMLEAELSYGVSFKTLLKWSFQRFATLVAAERALGITRQQLRLASQKLFGSSDIEKHFGSAADKEQKAATLTRRTWRYPSWVDERIKVMQPALTTIEAQYGISGVDGTSILANLGLVIGPDQVKQRKAAEKQSPRSSQQ